MLQPLTKSKEPNNCAAYMGIGLTGEGSEFSLNRFATDLLCGLGKVMGISSSQFLVCTVGNDTSLPPPSPTRSVARTNSIVLVQGFEDIV